MKKIFIYSMINLLLTFNLVFADNPVKSGQAQTAREQSSVIDTANTQSNTNQTQVSEAEAIAGGIIGGNIIVNSRNSSRGGNVINPSGGSRGGRVISPSSP